VRGRVYDKVLSVQIYFTNFQLERNPLAPPRTMIPPPTNQKSEAELIKKADKLNVPPAKAEKFIAVSPK
jgi:hypothetical protein